VHSRNASMQCGHRMTREGLTRAGARSLQAIELA